MTLNNTILAVALLQTIQVVIHVITADHARRQPRCCSPTDYARCHSRHECSPADYARRNPRRCPPTDYARRHPCHYCSPTDYARCHPRTSLLLSCGLRDTYSMRLVLLPGETSSGPVW